MNGDADYRTIGLQLREIRKAAGFASVKSAIRANLPFGEKTLYAYEQGRIQPNLEAIVALTRFYTLSALARYHTDGDEKTLLAFVGTVLIAGYRIMTELNVFELQILASLIIHSAWLPQLGQTKKAAPHEYERLSETWIKALKKAFEQNERFMKPGASRSPHRRRRAT